MSAFGLKRAKVSSWDQAAGSPRNRVVRNFVQLGQGLALSCRSSGTASMPRAAPIDQPVQQRREWITPSLAEIKEPSLRASSGSQASSAPLSLLHQQPGKPGRQRAVGSRLGGNGRFIVAVTPPTIMPQRLLSVPRAKHWTVAPSVIVTHEGVERRSPPRLAISGRSAGGIAPKLKVSVGCAFETGHHCEACQARIRRRAARHEGRAFGLGARARALHRKEARPSEGGAAQPGDDEFVGWDLPAQNSLRPVASGRIRPAYPIRCDRHGHNFGDGQPRLAERWT